MIPETVDLAVCVVFAGGIALFGIAAGAIALVLFIDALGVRRRR